MYNGYTPYDWYWTADDGRVYASARQAIVTEEDATFLAWKTAKTAQGLGPTPWPRDTSGQQTTAALQAALAPWPGLYADTSLSSLQARLCADIDAQAEARRLQYITPGAGQAQEYQEVFQEAQAAQSAGATATDVSPAPSPDPYPLLRAGIGVDINPSTGKPVSKISEAASAVLAVAAQYKTIAAALRNTRLATKAAINAATTAAAAQAAHDGVTWPY